MVISGIIQDNLVNPSFYDCPRLQEWFEQMRLKQYTSVSYSKRLGAYARMLQNIPISTSHILQRQALWNSCDSILFRHESLDRVSVCLIRVLEQKLVFLVVVMVVVSGTGSHLVDLVVEYCHNSFEFFKSILAYWSRMVSQQRAQASTRVHFS